MDRNLFVYIVTNKNNSVLYTGITNNLKRRIYQHRKKLMQGFTSRYSATRLVYYEVFEDAEHAILREKQIKAGSRRKKVDLIESMNKDWVDLYDTV